MTSQGKTWHRLKTEYLRRVEKALSSVKHPRSRDVLDDVSSHLDRRFAELEPAQQTRENLQAIIADMGPASDYAELLDPDSTTPTQKLQRRFPLWLGLAAIVIAAAILLSRAIPSKVKQHKHLTISKAYWFHSDERPRSIPAEAVPKDDDGHMLFHVDEWYEEMGTAKQYRSFLNQADERFVLKADGHPDVHANAERGCWSKEFYIRIPKKEYVKMEAGVTYTVHPVNSNPKYRWKVRPGVIICKPNQ